MRSFHPLAVGLSLLISCGGDGTGSGTAMARGVLVQPDASPGAPPGSFTSSGAPGIG